jgi:hypothetical protein
VLALPGMPGGRARYLPMRLPGGALPPVGGVGWQRDPRAFFPARLLLALVQRALFFRVWRAWAPSWARAQGNEACGSATRCPRPRRGGRSMPFPSRPLPDGDRFPIRGPLCLAKVSGPALVHFGATGRSCSRRWTRKRRTSSSSQETAWAGCSWAMAGRTGRHALPRRRHAPLGRLDSSQEAGHTGTSSCPGCRSWGWKSTGTAWRHCAGRSGASEQVLRRCVSRAVRTVSPRCPRPEGKHGRGGGALHGLGRMHSARLRHRSAGPVTCSSRRTRG